MNAPARHEVIVIGGGQAGLALGYHLARAGRRLTFKLAFTSRTTYTYGDRSVSDHWAGRGFGVLVEGDVDGAHTEF
jgi:tRNA U34 5-carboxymethylaminomethyl modifying enzyme MnmG/GidA